MSIGERTGTVVGGKYRLVRLIGEGGMGEVYEAQHVVIGRRFAIKFLHAHLARSPEFMERFQREARAAGALENENIAAAVDFGVTDHGTPFLVMEFLEGEDLGRLLARTGPLPIARAVDIVIQACRGLVAAHDRNIVHRDLKPENLFLCRRNDGGDLVKVLDFGIAKLHDQGQVTRTGATMGTPAYMSIEQARGAHEVDQRTDIYALGVILYELLSGVRPHPGSSYNEIIVHIATETPAPLGGLRPLPSALCAVVERAMAREAEHRFSSVIELWEALTPFAEGPVPSPRSKTMAPEGKAVGDAPPPSPMDAPALSLSPRRRRIRGWWAVLPVLAITAAWLAVRGRAPGPSAPTTPGQVATPVPRAEAMPAVGIGAPRLADGGRDAGTRPGEAPPSSPAARPMRPRPTRIPATTSAAPAGPSAAPAGPSAGPRRARPFDRTNPYDD
jgi:eukaryotic-like serine/threonine-protein kinase